MNCSVEIDHDEATEFHVWNIEGRAMQDDDRCACGAIPWSEHGICVRKGNVTSYGTRGFFGWIEFEIDAPVIEEHSGEMLSAFEAAKRAGVSKWIVYRALGERAFAGAVSEGGRWMIPASSVDQWSHGGPDRQRAVLAYVTAHPGARLEEIGAQIGVKKSTAHKVVDTMIAAGSLRRDKRGRVVTTVPHIVAVGTRLAIATDTGGKQWIVELVVVN